MDVGEHTPRLNAAGQAAFPWYVEPIPANYWDVPEELLPELGGEAVAEVLGEAAAPVPAPLDPALVELATSWRWTSAGAGPASGLPLSQYPPLPSVYEVSSPFFFFFFLVHPLYGMFCTTPSFLHVPLLHFF